jgi:hypothetical protein
MSNTYSKVEVHIITIDCTIKTGLWIRTGLVGRSRGKMFTANADGSWSLAVL